MICLVAVSQAQWVEMNGPYGGYVTSVLAKGNEIFVGTYGSGVFRSTNDGNSWIRMNAGLSNRIVRSLATDGNTLLAGTYDGGVFLSSNSGGNWVDISLRISDLSVISLAIVGPRLIAGTISGALRSTDQGISWEPIDLGPGQYEVAAIASRDSLVILASWNLFRSSDYGVTWSVITSVQQHQIQSLAISEKKIFAGTAYGAILRSTDRGMTWLDLTVPPSAQSIEAIIITTGQVIAGTGDGKIFRSTDDGDTWIDDGFVSQAVLSLASRENILFCGGDGILRSRDSGASWQTAVQGLSANYVTRIWTIGSNLLAGTIGAGLFRSSDDGQNWEPANDGINGPLKLSVGIRDSTFYAVTRTERPGSVDSLYQSTDFGATWAGVSAAPIMSTVDVKTTPSSIFVAGWGIHSSGNNGNSWTALYQNESISAIDVSGQDIFAYSNGYGWILHSTNLGLTWTGVNVGPFSSGREFLITDSLVYMVGWQGVFRSAIRGDTWTKVNSGFAQIEANGITKSHASLFVANGSSGVYRSNDAGDSWSAINEGMTDMYIFSVRSNNNYLFAGGLGGGVWRRPLTEIVTDIDQVRSAPMPRSFSLEQNYPNPFNPETHIEFSLNRSGHTTLKVFNILGQEVEILADEFMTAGRHHSIWKPTNQPNGVYVYRLSSSGQTLTKKLVLLR